MPSLLEEAPITIECSNLLNHQIFEEMKECMCNNSVDLVAFLELLRDIKKIGLPKQ